MIVSDVPITVCLPLPGQDAIITGHPDGSVRRWDVRTGMVMAGTPPTGEFVWTLACTPDSKRLLPATGVAQRKFGTANR